MWAHICVAILGIWIMSAPSVLRYTDPARTNDWIVGPLIATFGIIAIWQATRNIRWVNTGLGAWLVIVPWILGYGNSAAGINSMCTGLAVALLSLIRGKMDKRFGGRWISLFRRYPPHELQANCDT